MQDVCIISQSSLGVRHLFYKLFLYSIFPLENSFSNLLKGHGKTFEFLLLVYFNLCKLLLSCEEDSFIRLCTLTHSCLGYLHSFSDLNSCTIVTQDKVVLCMLDNIF